MFECVPGLSIPLPFLTIPVTHPGLSTPCLQPRTPFQPPGSVSPGLCGAAAGPISSSPQPCLATGPAEPSPPAGPRPSWALAQPSPWSCLVAWSWSLACLAPSGCGGMGPGEGAPARSRQPLTLCHLLESKFGGFCRFYFKPCWLRSGN